MDFPRGMGFRRIVRLGIHMKGVGKMEEHMDMESFIGRMEIGMKVVGSVVFRMDLLS